MRPAWPDAHRDRDRRHGDGARRRAYSVIEAASGVRAYAAIVDAETIIDGASDYVSNTAYRVVRRIDDAALTGAKTASISVEWADRSGAMQRVGLDSVTARSDPAYSGALALGTGAAASRAAAVSSRRRAIWPLAI